MSTAFVPYGPYEDIINLLGYWKVMDMKSLHEMNSYDLEYPNLLKKVRKLEQEGIVKGVLLGRKNKHIYLTDKGISYTPFDYTQEISKENLTHDLTTARVLREFLSWQSFTSGKMFHQVTSENLLPDAEAVGVKNGERFSLALEVELTQKSESRVKEKYRRYARGEVFNYALFITNKQSLYKAYKGFLGEMKREVQEAVILIHVPKLSVTKCDCTDAECYFMGQTVSFEELFGERKELS